MKECNNCKLIKDISLFYKDKSKKDGFRNICKDCESKKRKEYYKKNSIYIKENVKKWVKENIQHLKEYNKKYSKENKDSLKKYNKKWREENKDSLKEYNKKWREENKDNLKKYKKEYNDKNKKIRNKNQIEYRKNPKNKLKHNISNLIRNSLKRHGVYKNKKKSFGEILPFTFDELYNHLESKFEEGMTWNNYGKEWVIDHVVPDSWFSYFSIEDDDFLKSWDLKNLQPLWKKENETKNNRYSG